MVYLHLSHDKMIKISWRNPLSKWLSGTQNWTAANKTIMTSIYLGCLVAHHYSTRNLLVIGFWKSPLQNVTYEFSDHLLKFLGDGVFFHSLSFFYFIFFSSQELQKLLKCSFLCHWPAFLLCLAVDESLGRSVCNPDGEPENRASVSGSPRTPDFSER